MDTLSIQRLKSLTILYVEDEDHIREKISDTLSYYVKNVIQAENGQVGYKKYLEFKPDVILSDILMPIVDGIKMVEMIREIDVETPIVMITAHTEKEYLLDAVKLHLENYLVKPVALHNILKSLHLCMKKISLSQTFTHTSPKGFTYDVDDKILIYNKQTFHLSKKEISFLELLMQNIHRIVLYEELQTQVWKDDIMTDNAVRSLVNGLRKKLPKNTICNLSGIGYKLKNG